VLSEFTDSSAESVTFSIAGKRQDGRRTKMTYAYNIMQRRSFLPQNLDRLGQRRRYRANNLHVKAQCSSD